MHRLSPRPKLRGSIGIILARFRGGCDWPRLCRPALAVEFGKKLGAIGYDLPKFNVQAYQQHSDLIGEVTAEDLTLGMRAGGSEVTTDHRTSCRMIGMVRGAGHPGAVFGRSDRTQSAGSVQCNDYSRQQVMVNGKGFELQSHNSIGQMFQDITPS